MDYLKEKLNRIDKRIQFLKSSCSYNEMNEREIEVLLTIKSEIEHYMETGKYAD